MDEGLPRLGATCAGRQGRVARCTLPGVVYRLGFTALILGLGFRVQGPDPPERMDCPPVPISLALARALSLSHTFYYERGTPVQGLLAKKDT